MAVVIEKMLVSETASNCPKTKLILVNGEIGATIHGTGNFRPGTDARNQAQYNQSADARARQVCCHGYVDDHRFVQTHRFDRIGWHAGDGCENPATDYGCYSTLGIEGCESSSVDLMGMLQMFAETLALIAIGSDKFDWGDGHTRGKLSLNQLKQHIWVSQEVPPHDCPYKIRHANLWAQFMTMIDGAYATASGVTPPPPPPPPPGVTLPPGMTVEIAIKLFGVTHDTNGARYSFNPEGQRSKRWLDHGIKSIPAGETWLAGSWPSIESVFVTGAGKGTKVLQYSDGWLDDGKSKVT